MPLAASKLVEFEVTTTLLFVATDLMPLAASKQQTQ